MRWHGPCAARVLLNEFFGTMNPRPLEKPLPRLRHDAGRPSLPRSKDILLCLPRAEVLCELPRTLLDALVADGRTISLSRGAVIFSPGDPPALYLTLHGRITMLTRPTPDTEIIIFERNSGEVFGEASLLLGRQVLEARAADHVVAFRMGADCVHAVLRESQPATLALATLLARRMASTETRLGAVAIYKVKERLRYVLQELATERNVADSRGYILRDRLTHQALAHMVGAQRVSVSRALAELRREGAILVRGRRIVVRSPNGMANEWQRHTRRRSANWRERSKESASSVAIDTDICESIR